jgi:hypothetical protein
VPGLLDRTLIWNQPHLLHALGEFEEFYNGHRPHQGIANAGPLQPLPAPLVTPDQIASLHIRRRDRLGGVLHEYRHAGGLLASLLVSGRGTALADRLGKEAAPPDGRQQGHRISHRAG